MVKKLDELNKPYKDPNSPESQEFLRNLQKRILEGNVKIREMIKKWQDEDRNNETNRN